MSYILDALKKSDQERQQGTAPNLHSAHGAIIPMDTSETFVQRHLLWLVGGGLLLFFLGCGLLFFFYQKHATQKALLLDVTESNSPIKEQSVTTASGGDIPKRSQITTKPATIKSIPIDLEEHPYPPAVVVKKQNNVIRSIPVRKRETTNNVVKVPEEQQDLPLLKELSSELRTEIPRLKFAAHTYAAEPSQRMIIINGTILREGDIIAPDTILEEITWEGVIIDFKSIRFKAITN